MCATRIYATQRKQGSCHLSVSVPAARSPIYRQQRPCLRRGPQLHAYRVHSPCSCRRLGRGTFEAYNAIDPIWPIETVKYQNMGQERAIKTYETVFHDVTGLKITVPKVVGRWFSFTVNHALFLDLLFQVCIAAQLACCLCCCRYGVLCESGTGRSGVNEVAYVCVPGDVVSPLAVCDRFSVSRVMCRV